MGRYFIAVVPQGLSENAELKQLLGKMKRTLRERDREVRWVHPDLWHVTVSFLGTLPPDRHLDLCSLLDKWRSSPVAEVTLRLHGIGAYPVEEQARVLWVGVGENQQFINLQAELTSVLRTHGFELEDRPYHPHLTLARFRNSQSVTDLVKLGGRKHFGDYKINELILFESVLQGNIIKYVPLIRRPFF